MGEDAYIEEFLEESVVKVVENVDKGWMSCLHAYPAGRGQKAEQRDETLREMFGSGKYAKRELAGKAGLSEQRVGGILGTGGGTQRSMKSKAEVVKIKRMRASGVTQMKLAEMFDCSQSTICLILNGKYKAWDEE